MKEALGGKNDDVRAGTDAGEGAGINAVVFGTKPLGRGSSLVSASRLFVLAEQPIISHASSSVGARPRCKYCSVNAMGATPAARRYGSSAARVDSTSEREALFVGGLSKAIPRLQLWSE